MITVAHKWRIVPALFGKSDLQFAPLHIDDFGKLAVELISRRQDGVKIEHLCGPEDLTGVDLALRISRHCRALPLPLWWPLAVFSFKTLNLFGFAIVKPDQIKRLSARKTATAASSNTNSAGLRRFLLQEELDS
jgi:hypothetical protein